MDSDAPENFQDRFPRGRIIKYFPQGGYGFVKDAHGRDIYFHVDEVRLLGGKKKSDIKEGLEVGYDLTVTSRGFHITRLKIYDLEDDKEDEGGGL